VDIESAKPVWKPQNKTSQTRLSRGTLVEQPLPRKFVQEHPSDAAPTCEWPEWATRMFNVYAGFPFFLAWTGKLENYRTPRTCFATL
jgi:hypothetical protein